MAEKPFKVFVSHAAEDTWVATQIAAHLERCGAATFLDEAHIAVGDDWEERIIVESDDSDELLVLLTPEVLKRSKFVWMEVGMFRKARRRVVWAWYKVTARQINNDDRAARIIHKLDSIQLNDIDRYFDELRRRVSAPRGTT